MSTRLYSDKPGQGEADFNPIGENLANNFLHTRNHTSADYSRHEIDSIQCNGMHSKLSGRGMSTSNPSDRGDRDLWASGGQHLSTNKLSLMLSDMQVYN